MFGKFRVIREIGRGATSSVYLAEEVVDGASADVTFRNVPSGSVLPFRPGFVRATGTTAADIVALY